MRRYDRVWLDRGTGNQKVIDRARDGFANRAAGPFSPAAVRALRGSKRLDGARDLADRLNELPPSRLADVTDQFTG